MQNIPILLAAPEMVLARDVRRSDSQSGPPICGKGVVLSESLIERLKAMGVQQVTVEGHPVWLEGDKTLPELLELLEKRFRKVDHEPLMNRLKEIYKAQLIRSMDGAD